MVVGIGVDTTTISRIEKSIARPGFLERFFGEKERMLFERKKTQTIAANFAAKEAFSKALGKGLVAFSWQDVQILRDAKGAPYLTFSGAAQRMMQDTTAFVSMTHEGDYATAFVVLERETL